MLRRSNVASSLAGSDGPLEESRSRAGGELKPTVGPRTVRTCRMAMNDEIGGEFDQIDCIDSFMA